MVKADAGVNGQRCSSHFHFIVLMR